MGCQRRFWFLTGTRTLSSLVPIQTGPSESQTQRIKTWTLLWGTCTWRVRHADRTSLERYLALKIVATGLPRSSSNVCETVSNAKRSQLMAMELLWAMAMPERKGDLARGELKCDSLL